MDAVTIDAPSAMKAALPAPTLHAASLVLINHLCGQQYRRSSEVLFDSALHRHAIRAQSRASAASLSMWLPVQPGLPAGEPGERRTVRVQCHCEKRSDAAIPIWVPNWPEIASPRLREGRNDNKFATGRTPGRVHPIALGPGHGVTASRRQRGGRTSTSPIPAARTRCRSPRPSAIQPSVGA